MTALSPALARRLSTVHRPKGEESAGVIGASSTVDGLDHGLGTSIVGSLPVYRQIGEHAPTNAVGRGCGLVPHRCAHGARRAPVPDRLLPARIRYTGECRTAG